MLGLKVVRKGADYDWLRNQSRNKKTTTCLNELQKDEKKISEGNFSSDTSVFPLKLNKHTLWFRRSDASYSLQIYTEIFRENDHFLVDDFLHKKACVVIDLGAHIGFYTLKAKQLSSQCKVIAVEADPDVFNLLQKNISVNKVKGITLVNKAVAAKNGNIKFQSSIYAGVLGSKYLSSLKRDLRPWLKDSMIKTSKVKSITLSALMNEHNVDIVDLVKLDIENMEYEVLKASEDVLGNIKCIVTQWHDVKTRDKVVELLKAHGFGITYQEPRDFGDIYFVNSRFTRL